ncbi:MAG TPA: c-type cytochrome domain-containing protein, partial [Vicinamibacterales bacterium]|nr:c-type cytochrome domain-containing protein [Vicinamibacterales bacterium]
MRRLVPAALGALLVTIGVLVHAQVSAPSPAPPVSFASDVAPILERSCLSCHGETPMGKLDLRTREAALRGGTRGSDLVPRDADASRLYRRIAGLEKPAMPAQGGALTAAQIATIKQWIDEGAAWDVATLTANAATAASALAALERREITPEERSYWAFKLPVQAALPAVDAR